MLSMERQLAIIDGQIQEWEEVAFNAEIAHKVHKDRLGAQPPALAQFVTTMERAEKAIAELQKMRAELIHAPTGA